jgi:hypothetical protein
MIGPFSAGQGNQIAAKSRPCCGCSKCGRKSDRTSDPMPTTPQHCPCQDHDLSTPESNSPIDAAVALPPVVLIVVPVDLAIEQNGVIKPLTVEPDTSLHVLNCLWLC